MDENILKAASLESKAAIEELEIVTPPVYSAIFYDIAKKYGLDEDKLKEATLELIEERVAKLIDLNSKSSRHIETLDGASKKALHAMKERDEALLKESISETEALRREIEKLKESVYRDSLTQTWNREWLNANCLDGDGNFKRAYSLAIVDLNYFKEINDNLGHIAGDKVLKYVSSHLKSLGAPVVRYGGDEFLILFNSADGAEQIDECRESIISKKLKYNDHTFVVSFSYGTYDCEEGEHFNEALKEADKKMYEDKEAIKKRIPPPFR